MRIKKYENNEYILAGNVWIRNFTKENVSPICLANLYNKEDRQLVLRNEETNKSHLKISNENLNLEKMVIVSDGYDFDRKHQILSQLPNDVWVLSVNKALKKWKLTSGENKKYINAYVVNNPYDDCMSFMPLKKLAYYPTCIASSRTNVSFIKKYKGNIFLYRPTPEEAFGYDRNENYFIDDYRNPICASIGLAYRFGVSKLMLLSCDDSFEEERDFAVQLKNGLWTYPQHLISQEIIDANLYWLKNQENEIEVVDYSDGADYKNAAYISNEEEVINFFKKDEEMSK